jgi:hypothetical protein
MDGQKTTLHFDTMPSSVRILQCCLPCPSTSHMRTHAWISGSDVKSFCCYGLEYPLDDCTLSLPSLLPRPELLEASPHCAEAVPGGDGHLVEHQARAAGGTVGACAHDVTLATHAYDVACWVSLMKHRKSFPPAHK